MLIVGDVSGIQDFIFDLPEEQGGQARMLRARSFYVQILTEVIAFRVQRALGLGRESLLFCAAGKFVIEGVGDPESLRPRLAGEREAIEGWLARETTGALQIALACHADERGTASPAERYDAAMAELQRHKLRSWATVATGGGGGWLPERLVLQPRRRGQEVETFRRIGAALPSAKRLLVMDDPEAVMAADEEGPVFGLPGFSATLRDEAPASAPVVLKADFGRAFAERRRGEAAEILRPLARHVPRHPDGSPVWFEELARAARGAPCLGVLKMDADSLGLVIRDRLRAAADLRELGRFSAELDDFFAIELTNLLEGKEWEATYTVFSGGDDLLLVGPWDRALDLAREVERRFRDRFGASGLTISGGLAVVRYRYPIRRAAAQAEELLERAKTTVAPGAGAKNQIAALGQVWGWRDHAMVVTSGKRLAGWVEAGVARRGWLHTLLQFTLLRRGDVPKTSRAQQLAATARLAYHVDRNYPARGDRDPERQTLRAWIDRILDGFDRYDDVDDPELVFLPAIVRYALLATRTDSQEADA